MNMAAPAPAGTPAADAPRQVPGRPEKWRLGDVLIQQRLISQEQLQQTLALQRTTGKKVGRLLIETGVTTEELLANGLARQLRMPFVNLKTFPSVRKSSNCCPRASDNQRYCPVSAKCRAGRLGAGLSECRVASGTGMGASCTPETPAGQASRHVGGAYHIALQLGPAEQRWHLGAAVSLAALGQTASAAEMAEKARAMGAVSKDVQTYLRQMGVEVKD